MQQYFLRYDGFGQVATPQGTTGAVHYYTGDQVGTIQMEFTGGGASLGGWPVWQGQFAPFGQELDDPSRTLNRYRFNGKERDAESGLDYFGARYYAGSIARWMSPDWAAAAVPVPYASLADPQTFNLYSFVANNPLRQGDPDGHMGLNNSQPEECFANTSGSGCSTQQQMQDAQKDAAAKAAQQQNGPPSSKVPAHLVVESSKALPGGAAIQYIYQLTNAKGKLLKGDGYAVKEQLFDMRQGGPEGTGSTTSQDRFVPAPNGRVADSIGYNTIDTKATEGFTAMQRFIVSIGGKEYSPSTVFFHQVTVQNGVLTKASTETIVP